MIDPNNLPESHYTILELLASKPVRGWYASDLVDASKKIYRVTVYTHLEQLEDMGLLRCVEDDVTATIADDGDVNHPRYKHWINDQGTRALNRRPRSEPARGFFSGLSPT